MQDAPNKISEKYLLTVATIRACAIKAVAGYPSRPILLPCRGRQPVDQLIKSVRVYTDLYFFVLLPVAGIDGEEIIVNPVVADVGPVQRSAAEDTVSVQGIAFQLHPSPAGVQQGDGHPADHTEAQRACQPHDGRREAGVVAGQEEQKAEECNDQTACDVDDECPGAGYAESFHELCLQLEGLLKNLSAIATVIFIVPAGMRPRDQANSPTR